MLLSVLIPAFQEERSIAEVLRRVRAVDTESLGFDKEIIVCDDGSADGTAALIEQAATEDPRIRRFVNREQADDAQDRAAWAHFFVEGS